MSTGFRVPPPDAITSVAPSASTASATVRAVDIVSVATTSCALSVPNPAGASRRYPRWNSSLPVVFGAGSAQYGSADSRSSKGSWTLPRTARAR